jgi:SAM-dependent methyltransferase
MLRPEVMEYYRRGGERTRLADGPGRLEFLRTWDVLCRVLPEPPASVLDVGGATGVYAGPLARNGYRVHVLDPVPEHVSDAAARPGVSAAVADARHLPVADRSVDAVLLHGPLYHLLERAERVAAWREAGRVLRPGGVVVGATISRFAALYAGFAEGAFRDPRFRSLVDGGLDDGRHRNTDPALPYFTSAYFHHPDELADEVADAGLLLRRRLVVEGAVGFAGPWIAEMLADPAQTELWLTMMRRVEDDPTLLGASAHVLAVAQLRAAAQ